MKHLQVRLTDADIQQIEAFAKKRSQDSALYRARGNFKNDDILVGAAAEIAACKLLNRAGITVSKPDFAIYSARKKSYSPDLMSESKGFHVKGQKILSALTYGNSWILQKDDPIINLPISGHYFVLCSVDYEAKLVYIYSCVPVLTICRLGLFSLLKLEYLNKTKTAIYLDNIKEKLTLKQLWSVLYDYGSQRWIE